VLANSAELNAPHINFASFLLSIKVHIRGICRTNSNEII